MGCSSGLGSGYGGLGSYTGLSSGMGCGSGFGSGYDVGCSIGMCQSGYSPYYMDSSLYGGGLLNSYQSGGFDITVNINLFGLSTPSYIPSFPNCGGGVIQCPGSQMPPTTYYPPTGYPPTTYPPMFPPTTYPPTTFPPTTPHAPQPSQEVVPTDPIRFRVPRTATH